MGCYRPGYRSARISTHLADCLVGQKFFKRIDGWDQASWAQTGHFVRLLGPIGDIDAKTMALLVENKIKLNSMLGTHNPLNNEVVEGIITKFGLCMVLDELLSILSNVTHVTHLDLVFTNMSFLGDLCGL